jgi:hypothetical protein
MVMLLVSGSPGIFYDDKIPLDKQYYVLYSITRKEVFYGWAVEAGAVGCVCVGGH